MHLKYSVACVHIPVCLLWLRMAFFFFFFCFLSLLFNFHVKHTGCSLAQSASPPSLNSSIWTATGHDCDPQSGNFSHLPQNGNQFRFDTVYLKVNSWNTAVDGTELSTSPLVELWDNHPKKTFCTSSKLLSLVFFFLFGGGGILKLFQMWRKLVRDCTEWGVLRTECLNTTWKSSCSVCVRACYPSPPTFSTNTKDISGTLSVYFGFVCLQVCGCCFFSSLDKGRYSNKITNSLQMKQVLFRGEISSIWIEVLAAFLKNNCLHESKPHQVTHFWSRE